MTYKAPARIIFVKVLLLSAGIAGVVLLFYYHLSVYLLLLVPFVIFLVADLYNFLMKSHREMNQFVESVRYRDFSRHFDVKHAPPSVQPMRKGFNEINVTFKAISREKETQYQYLQKILELVDTGILSFEEATGDVLWINETLKTMLHVPYMKNIHTLAKRDENFYNELVSITPGNSRIVTLHLERFAPKLLLSATLFQTEGKMYKLVACQNVNEALDETESKAWQKLLRVLTHEIMNSVAPISSLAETLQGRLQESVPLFSNQPELLEDLDIGVDTIRRRSEGLLKFAETYRQLNNITSLQVKTVNVGEVFRSLLHLMQPTIQQKQIAIETSLQEAELIIEADTHLLEQVLINLFINAADALKDTPDAKIRLSGYRDAALRPVITVSDNGPGISLELLDKIFIPFFSTKKNGSGIGLSLCKQIMMLHKGSIQVESAEGKGTTFMLLF